MNGGPTLATPRQGATPSLFSVLFPSVTLLLIVAAASGLRPGASIILILLVGGVVILGLPHGALDPLVATQLWGARQSFTMIRFVILYSGIAAFCAAVWMILPNAALIGFLCISAYHFGSDWDGRCKTWGQSAYGIVIVSVPTLCKAAQVEEIYRLLGATVAHQIVTVSQVFAVVAVAGALFAASALYKFRIPNLVELSTVVVGGLVLPPLLFFTCYFCLLHSPRHLIETARRLGLIGAQDIARSAAPTVLATLVLGGVLWAALPGSVCSQKVTQLVFIGLASLTMPHVLLTELSLRWCIPSIPTASGIGSH